jgi:GAF domain-containing protein
MNDFSREDMLLDTFADLADTLVDNYDVVDLLQSLVEACAQLVDVSEAAILLVGDDGNLSVVASTSESSRLVEVMQLSAEAGPCIESFKTGIVVSVPDISQSPVEWSEFQKEATTQGFQSVYAIPLRLREQTIGALNLMRSETGELDPHDVRAAKALADVATIGILHERALNDAVVLQSQLAHALESRVTIEQAKGVVSHQLETTTDEAFALIRSYARSHGLLLSGVASDIASRKLVLRAS